jgi:Na+/melibiose symporter-like transporter
VTSLSRLRDARPVSVLRRRGDLRLLLAANLVSQSGDWILGIGIAYSVYDLTGSTMASAASLLAGVLPQVVAGPVAGVLVDRWDRRRTMIGANIAMALGILPLLLVTDADLVWLVYGVLAVQAVIEVFFAPAEQAFLPRLVEDQELVTANALNGQAGHVARLGGSALGGVAAAVGGIPAVALLDGLSFVVAAGLLCLVRTRGSVRPDEQPSAEEVLERRTRAFLRDLRAGVDVVRRSRALTVILVFSLITSVGEGIMGTLFAPFVRDVIHGGGAVYGLITASQAIGGVVGAGIAAAVGHRFSPVVLLGAGSVLFGALDLAIFLYPLGYQAVWPAVLGMILVGFPGAVVMAGYLTLFQRSTDDAARGRAYSLVALGRTVALVLGTTAAGVLGERVGIVPVLAFQGVGYVVAGAVVLAALRPDQASAPS